jgi:hypothetical protein
MDLPGRLPNGPNRRCGLRQFQAGVWAMTSENDPLLPENDSSHMLDLVPGQPCSRVRGGEARPVLAGRASSPPLTTRSDFGNAGQTQRASQAD